MNDPNRYSRKGLIYYYDRSLHHNICRNTDTTGTLTDKPAKIHFQNNLSDHLSLCLMGCI